ncbi:dipeptide/oligopeptide/nickel ABC transporter ATP-binding protein [Clostridium sp. NSJ-145]|uniref:ABC transporter ATP-binding protein n=1 Tax=Clostridium sp. NSJ-145 TaxID=2897777 RepID=UPI001E493920|nr:dipeptide/oligopeptide/nickel ABC transporter ATP-binding protein [Clostridium sp. NSJ-145]MDU6341339.1 ABC transporter ATP-binding protein [Clostridium sp.]
MQEVLRVSSIKKTFSKGGKSNTVINEVSFTVNKGQCVGIVGESGCGKSTTARIISGLLDCDEGEISLSGNILSKNSKVRLKEVQGKIQMVFQMPTESFNPRIKLGKSIKEAMSKTLTSVEKEEKLKNLFDECLLEYELADRYPKEVSGGQCQRAAIARALASDPELLICDEATSALDVTVQHNIIKLLKNIQKNRDMAILFICHDIALVQQFCDYILVMDEGKIIEEGTVNEIILNPKEVFTKKLISSVI